MGRFHYILTFAIHILAYKHKHKLVIMNLVYNYTSIMPVQTHKYKLSHIITLLFKNNQELRVNCNNYF